MVPANPGGGWDATGRAVLTAMETEGIHKAGAQVTNKGGAGGTIGLAEFVSTMKGNDSAMMVMGVIMVGGILTNKSPVTLEQVTPLARLTIEYNAIAVAPNSPFKTVKDLADALKADPGKVAVGGGSAGGVDHITLALIGQAVGVPAAKLNYVAFQGGGEMIAAVAGGKLAAAISGASEFKQYVDTGRLRLLAVTSEARLPGTNAPTLKESGRQRGHRQLARPGRASRHDGRRPDHHGRDAGPDGEVQGVAGDAQEAGLGRRLPLRRGLRRIPQGRERADRDGPQGGRPGQVALDTAGAETRPVKDPTGSASAPAARPWGLGVAVIVLGLVWISGAFNVGHVATYAVVGPALFPALTGAGLVVLGALLLVAVARGERFEPQETEDADAGRRPSRAAFWTTVIAGAVPIVVVRPLGFPVAAALTFALTARAFGSRRLPLDLLVGFLLGVACWLLFSRLLGLSLPGFPPLGL